MLQNPSLVMTMAHNNEKLDVQPDTNPLFKPRFLTVKTEQNRLEKPEPEPNRCRLLIGHTNIM